MHQRTDRVPRLYVEGEMKSGEAVDLPPHTAHHAAGVMRLRPGDPLVLFNGRGGEYDAAVARIERGRLSAAVGAWRALERESPLAIVLAQGISSGERMDFTIQKAVELGVASIQPLLCEKSVVRLNAARAAARMAHWRRVVIAACEQSGRNRLPELAAPLPVAQYCARQAGAAQAALRLLLKPEASASLRMIARRIDHSCLLAAGPESGFSAAEERAFERAGFVAARLGPRILRTETAALAALAVLNGLHGDL